MTRIGSWHLEGRLGVGRLGALHIAQDAAGRRGCIRTLDPQLTAGPQGQRLLEVVRQLAARDLPMVVSSLDVVQAHDRWHVVVEDVPGPALRDLLDPTLIRTRLGHWEGDPSAAIAVLYDVAQGCQALRAAGLAHGSLSPAAVLLRSDGTACLSDPALLAIATQTPLDAASDARAWADVARTLARAWIPAQSTDLQSLIERSATTAEQRGDVAAGANELRAATSLLANADSHASLSRAVARWVTTAPGPALVTSLDDDVDATLMGSGPAISTPPPAGSTIDPTATSIDVPPAPAGQTTVIDAPVGSGPTMPSPPPPAATSAGPRYRLGATPTATPAPAAAEPSAHDRERQSAGRSSFRASPLLASGPAVKPLPAWDSAPRRTRTRKRRWPWVVAALLVLAVIGTRNRSSGTNLQVLGAQVVAPATAGCNAAIPLTGRIGTNGGGGTITYQWTRGQQVDPQQTITVPGDQRGVDVQALWQVQGQGDLTLTASLVVLSPNRTVPATNSIHYTCH